MKQSKLFTKTLKDVSKEEVSKNAQLLLRGGFADRLSAGIYSYLPLGLRVLQKIEHIVREEMNKVGGQEILMPALHPRENWDTTGRWDVIDVLFKLTGHGDKEYALGATHEEIVTPLVQKFVVSYKDLPTSVYQMQTKFRNEPRAKSGILRGREFRMKDMYSFHTTQEDLDAYYDQVTAAYKRIYERCGLGGITYVTYASGGAFSKYSHEFQTLTDAGEDVIFVCEKCRVAVNKEILEDVSNACPECGNAALVEKKAIEVGNIFKLGTTFSDAFAFAFVDENGEKKSVIMGCYGIGPSRVLGTIVEALADDRGMVWPKEIAPYQVHLVSLCKDEEHVKKCDEVYNQLIQAGVEVLYDDRPGVRPGEKFADSDLIGISTRIIVSPKTLEQDAIEIKGRTEDTSRLVNMAELLSVVSV